MSNNRFNKSPVDTSAEAVGMMMTDTYRIMHDLMSGVVVLVDPSLPSTDPAVTNEAAELIPIRGES